MKIGTITTGQTPREDIIPKLIESIGIDVAIKEIGVFDNFSRKEVIELDHIQDDYTMIAVMRDGEQIKVAQRHIEAGIKKCIFDLENSDVDMIVLLCTGKFPDDIRSTKLLLKPNIIIENIIKTLFPKDSSVAVIVPLLEQIPKISKKWTNTNPNNKIVFGAVSPYTGTNTEIKKVAKNIFEANVDIIILDCLGYRKEAKDIFQKVTKKPVLLPSTLLGSVIRELI